MTAPMNQEAAEKIFGTLATNGSVESMGDQITGNIVSSITGLDSGEVASLTDFANELMGRDISLASRVARIEGKIAIGAEFFDDFNRGDSPNSLGNGWIQGGSGQGLGIYDQAAQLDRALLPSDGRRYAISPQGSTNDDVTVSAVIHPRGTPNNPSTMLFLRANTGLTEFVYAQFFNKRCYLGRGTRNGNSWNLTPWTNNTAKSYSNSSTIEFKAIGNKYQVVIDSVLVMDHEDISGYPIDSGHRTVGFALQTWTAILAIPEYSGGLASFAVRSSVELAGVQEANRRADQAVEQATTIATGVQTNLDREVVRLENKIEQVSTGGGVSAQRAIFQADGVWTKPSGFSRHVVDVIGAGGGGGRSNGGSVGGNPAGSGGFGGGWNGVEFFDTDLPAQVQITIGIGGAGATKDGSVGSGGTNSSFGTYLSAGGALPTDYGFGNKTKQIRGGSGGYVVNVGGLSAPSAATAGTGHDYANGGAGGTGTGGAAGGDGSPPSPATLPYPGTGGGGGARRAGIGNGGNGGNGGWPGGPGGGGGSYEAFGSAGNGGNGANGGVYITSFK